MGNGFTHLKTLAGISEYRFDKNALSVLLLEEHTAPVVTFMVTYRVGSRNESTGTTGATHLLEHLMFKGTQRFNKDRGTQIASTLQNLGARMNASTWFDRTNYYANLPADRVETAIEIEADRMRNSRLLAEDLRSEMTVVRNEFDQGENHPYVALDKNIWATAYQAHPYHHSTIGWRSDIENISIERLREFYNTFYWPNNATVTAIGEFESEDMLGLIKKYFGSIPASPEPIPVMYTEEPDQEGPRRVVVSRTGQLGVVGLAHKTPRGVDPDTYPLIILQHILTHGKTSRLYRRLIDTGLATNLFASHHPFHDPGLFTLYAFLTPGTEHKEVEGILVQTLEELKSTGISDSELSRAIKQNNARTLFGRDGSYAIAAQLNEAIAVGDWTFYVTYLDRIRKVTREDVHRVVRKYFSQNQRTTGYFIPKGETVKATTAIEPGIGAKELFYDRDPVEGDIRAEGHGGYSASGTPAAVRLSGRVERSEAGPIRLFAIKTGVPELITVTGSFPAGDFFTPSENSMIADVVGHMLDKGTKKHDKYQLAEKLENLGASIGFSVGSQTLSYSARCLKSDLPAVLNLLAEQLREPEFDSGELEKLKKIRTGQLQQALEDTNHRAAEALGGLVFPAGHPNHPVQTEKLIEDLGTVTVEALSDFHRDRYGPCDMLMVGAGDLPEGLTEMVASAFDGWSGGKEFASVKPAGRAKKPLKRRIEMPDKASVALMIGQATTLRDKDPDHLPLSAGSFVLGGNFSARLMSIIRDAEGLTYGIYSNLGSGTFCDGLWKIKAAFSPENVDKGIESTWREIKRWIKDGVTQKELDEKKTTLIGSYKVQLATTAGIASHVLGLLQKGLDLEYLDRYPEDVSALTLDRVNRTVRQYLDPDTMHLAMAGTFGSKKNS